MMKANEINGQPNKIEASTRITGEIKSNADFRIDGDDATSGDYSFFFDASGDSGKGQVYIGGETLTDFQH